MMKDRRLDLLIYAHDGRGLGHASRSIAIGMAFRRLYPTKKLLFVSGCKLTRELMGQTPLDWIKLPSYETEVVNGKSIGQAGNSGYSDKTLGDIRRVMLRNLVLQLKPRCILADHMPQGKHKELRPALELSYSPKPLWILGVRGIVGDVSGVWSTLAQTLFKKHYHALLWYGDENVLGKDYKAALHRHFGITAVETGYISRLSELKHSAHPKSTAKKNIAGTISIPWAGKNFSPILNYIAEALNAIGASYGNWYLFTDVQMALMQNAQDLKNFSNLSFCKIMPTGASYANALLNSKAAIIYGGYNSLTDVLYAEVPALVLLRGMQDQEQEQHLVHLQQKALAPLKPLPEDTISAALLKQELEKLLNYKQSGRTRLNLNGAVRAATYLSRLIDATA
jgi:predicted glycosyltransferase